MGLLQIFKMVLINLSRLLYLITAVKECPLDFPQRKTVLWNLYSQFKETSSDVVSIEVEPDLERIVERNVEDEEDSRRRDIVNSLVDIFSRSSFSFPEKPSTVFLMPPIDKCPNCNESLVVVKPSRKGREAVAYTKEGPRVVEIYHRHCKKCKAKVYYCYYEYTKEDGQIYRRYLDHQGDYFSMTQDTFFSINLLEELTVDLFICDNQFVKFVEKYNKLVCKGEHKLVRQRLFPVWALYSISKRMEVEFPVKRTTERNLDYEEAFKHLYPQLKEVIDKKWLLHNCRKCFSRLVVMDGKVYN